MWIILTIFLIIVVFLKATEKYLNPYKLIMVFGKKGSGKTTYLTKLAINAIKSGQKVYSTVEIPGTYVFNVEDIGTLTFEPESLILIDEVGMIWDNRDYKGFKPCVRDFFKFQRQYKLTIYLFSQTFDVDKKLRDLTDEMWLLTNFARIWSMQRRIIKTITISNASENSSATSQLVDEYRFDSVLFGGLKFVYIPRWVVYFKSFDPKKLNYIQGEYMDFNQVQYEYLSNWNYFKNKMKIHSINIIRLIKSYYYSFIKRFKERFINHE